MALMIRPPFRLIVPGRISAEPPSPVVAGVVDDDFDASEALLGSAHHAGPLRHVGHVALCRDRVPHRPSGYPPPPPPFQVK
jgi:hypothetical protein